MQCLLLGIQGCFGYFSIPKNSAKEAVEQFGRSPVKHEFPKHFVDYSVLSRWEVRCYESIRILDGIYDPS